MTPNQNPQWIKNLEKAVNLIVEQKLQSQAQEIIGEIELKKKELKGETYFGNRFTKQGCGTEDKKIGYNQAIQDLEEIKNKIKERYGTK